jgi:hypothetical protein
MKRRDENRRDPAAPMIFQIVSMQIRGGGSKPLLEPERGGKPARKAFASVYSCIHDVPAI